ncbi:MAG: four helix bundle protein [Gemmatimonadales bacterium]
MGNFRKFEAWKACFDLTLAVFEATKAWPKAELFGITSQVRRAAVSAGANMAEGSGKHSHADFARYLDIANGSLAELEHLLLLLRELRLLPNDAWQRLDAGRANAAKLTLGLFRYFTSQPTPNRPGRPPRRQLSDPGPGS